MALSSLPLFHRVAGSRVVVLGNGAAAEAKRRLVERAGATCCGEPEAHHARLAFVALDDSAAAEAAAIRLRCKGLLVNVVDRPDLCDFTVPSILDRDPVLVAVGTGGASAGLAKQLRLRLEGQLPQSLGRLARALYDVREALRERFSDPAERRRALDAALTAGGPLDPLRDESAEQVMGWVESAQHVPGDRSEEIVISSDNPDDLTLRHARLLGEADTIIHDADVPEAILARARADAIRIEAGEVEGFRAGLTVTLRRQRPTGSLSRADRL